MISIIITTYNRASLVVRAIQSALSQTYNNIEIIIVDDCSGDGTKEVVKPYLGKRVKYIRNSVNIGLSASRNVGIAASRGEYISFLDDDDEITFDKSQLLLTELEQSHSSVGVAYSGYRAIYENEFAYSKTANHTGMIYKYVLKNCPCAIHSALIRRSCFDVVGIFDTRLKSAEDWDMWIRISKHFSFVAVPYELAIYYIHKGQMSTQIVAKIRARTRIIHKHFSGLKENPEILSWHYRRLGSLYVLAGNAVIARKYFIKSLLVEKKNYGSYAHLVFGCLPINIHKALIYRYGTRAVGSVRLIG